MSSNEQQFMERRLWERIQKGSPDECWTWTGLTMGKYGRVPKISVNGTYVSARRVLWELIHGDLDAHQNVGCSCLNRLCMNPEHLVKMGRNEKSTAVTGREKEIIERYRQGESKEALARSIGCSRGSIERILDNHDLRRSCSEAHELWVNQSREKVFQSLPEPVRTEIRNRYGRGEGLDRIAAEIGYGLTDHKVRNLLNQMGVPIRNKAEAYQMQLPRKRRKRSAELEAKT